MDDAPVAAGLMTGLARGSIVVDEFAVPIVDIRLANGLLVLLASVRGPVRAVSASDYRVHDQSGGLVFTAHSVTGLVWPAVPRGVTLIVECPVAVAGRTAQGVSSAVG